MPQRAIQKVIRPKILDMDATGCQHIINKINRDNEFEEKEQKWFKNNREKIKKKLQVQQGVMDNI